MDDQQTYLLNGLLARQFSLGRIVRFRKVERGRQAVTFELFTAQEREYLVQLYPAAYAAQELEAAAEVVNVLDGHRFSVVPFVKSKAGAFVAEGPQHAHLLVCLAPTGSLLAHHLFTEHDISQVGLRLAWMHSLLKEQLAQPPVQPPLAQRLRAALAAAGESGAGGFPLPRARIEPLFELLHLPAAQGWVHGDLQAQALLMDGDHQVRAIMDWGLFHGGSPLEDVVDAFLSLGSDRRGNLSARRGRALLESYHSLQAIERVPWTPVVASWCAQWLIDAAPRAVGVTMTGLSRARRPLPGGFETILAAPENLATAMASCL